MRTVHTALALVVVAALAIPAAAAYGVTHRPEERGMALFNDPNFAGGTRPCSQCHLGGKGLEKAGNKRVFNIMGGTQESLEEAVNACIVGGNKGKAIATDSKEMQDIVSYIRSIGKSEESGY